MNTFERQLRRSNNSWRTLVGAPGVTLLIFLAIASGTIVVDRPQSPELPELTFAYVPPRPVPEKKTTPPLSSSFTESFKFDPTMAAPLPEIPLEFLAIHIDPQVDPELAIEMDLNRPFEVSRPELTPEFTIFERHQVDEIPVWLYGPMPRIPHELRTMDGETLVLYVVTEKGRTENIYVLDASDPRFIPGVKEAIKDWRFRPARKNGKPVSVWVQHVVSYRPSSKSPFSL